MGFKFLYTHVRSGHNTNRVQNYYIFLIKMCKIRRHMCKYCHFANSTLQNVNFCSFTRVHARTF